MKRKILLGISLVLVFLFLVGCGERAGQAISTTDDPLLSAKDYDLLTLDDTVDSTAKQAVQVRETLDTFVPAKKAVTSDVAALDEGWKKLDAETDVLLEDLEGIQKQAATIDLELLEKILVEGQKVVSEESSNEITGRFTLEELLVVVAILGEIEAVPVVEIEDDYDQFNKKIDKLDIDMKSLDTASDSLVADSQRLAIDVADVDTQWDAYKRNYEDSK